MIRETLGLLCGGALVIGLIFHTADTHPWASIWLLCVSVWGLK